MRRRKQNDDLAVIREQVSAINTALIVREPGTARSVEAYEGLRRQVAQATTERRAHLVELVRLSEAIDRGVPVEKLGELVAGWSEQAGLRRIDDPSERRLFEVVGEVEPGHELEVVNPAWVAGSDAMLIRPGLARPAPLTQDDSMAEAVEDTPLADELGSDQ